MKAIFSRLKNKSDALEIIKYSALFNLLFVCITLLWAFKSDNQFFLDAFISFFFVLLFWMRHSRAAALLIMYSPVFAILYFLKSKIMNTPYQYDRWWLIVYILLIWLDIRGVEATFKLHGSLSCEKGNDNKI